MTIYSHSKLSTFEQCKQKYKFKYIDKIQPDFEQSIEAHLGSSVHNTLEWLYTEVLKKNTPSLDQVILKYTDFWQENYKENFKIVKQEFKPEDYFNKGVRFLITYYIEHQPFEDNTIETEKKVNFVLDEDFPYKIIGYIDRLTHDKERNLYEIHDYKTANTLPSKEKFETDRQLALYGLALKQIFGKDIKIKLVWHYLEHNKKIVSERTEQQFEQLRQDILKLIQEIKSTKSFDANTSMLCEWCEYKSSCPAWN